MVADWIKDNVTLVEQCAALPPHDHSPSDDTCASPKQAGAGTDRQYVTEDQQRRYAAQPPVRRAVNIIWRYACHDYRLLASNIHAAAAKATTRPSTGASSSTTCWPATSTDSAGCGGSC
jgi:hypothetical protein